MFPIREQSDEETGFDPKYEGARLFVNSVAPR